MDESRLVPSVDRKDEGRPGEHRIFLVLTGLVTDACDHRFAGQAAWPLAMMQRRVAVAFTIN